MNIYKVTYKSGFGQGNHVSKYVAAVNAAKAIENMGRHAKKNYVSNYEVIATEKILAVDVHYK